MAYFLDHPVDDQCFCEKKVPFEGRIDATYHLGGYIPYNPNVSGVNKRFPKYSKFRFSYYQNYSNQILYNDENQ